MDSLLCPHCLNLAAQGIRSVPPEPSAWCDSFPIAPDGFTRLLPGQSMGDFHQIWVCDTCHTLYRYRYHHEYDVAGSWEEYYFWRMGDVSQALLRSVWAGDEAIFPDAAMLVDALVNGDEYLKDDCTLLLWILLDNGLPLPESVLTAMLEALVADTGFSGNFIYRALLGYLCRGPQEARLLAERITQANITQRETRFGWILLKESGLQ